MRRHVHEINELTDANAGSWGPNKQTGGVGHTDLPSVIASRESGAAIHDAAREALDCFAPTSSWPRNDGKRFGRLFHHRGASGKDSKMSFLDPDDDEDDGLEDWSLRDAQSQSTIIVFFALVPTILVTILLAAVLGDWVFRAVLPMLFLGYVGFKVWNAYRYRDDHPKIWKKFEDAWVPGFFKTKRARHAAFIMFGLIVLGVLVQRYFPSMFYWLRDTLLAWTIPWPWDW